LVSSSDEKTKQIVIEKDYFQLAQPVEVVTRYISFCRCSLRYFCSGS
jgi:hypothetical protein